jgi:RND family efflux transporter MFP subunit
LTAGMRRALVAAGLTMMASGSALAGQLDVLAAKSSCLLEANSVIKLSSTTQGTLSKVMIKRGDRVAEGQVVAQLESDVEQAMYKAAQLRAASDVLIRAKTAEKVNAAKKFDRIRVLQGREVASVQALDDARTAAVLSEFAVAQAELERDLAASEADRLRATIERRTVRSPVKGVVTKLDLRTGEYADPANSIATIAEIQPILVEVYLPLEAYPLVKIGMSADVSPQQPIGGSYVGQVISKDPQIDSASGTFQVTLKIPNEQETIPAGVRCSIRFME